MIKRFKKKFHNHRRHIIDNLLPVYFMKHSRLSSLYYFLFSQAFQREHKAVLSGKVHHLKTEEKYFLLVRNTHRIEKGLLMRPRKNSFGRDYIEETVHAYIKLANSNSEFKNSKQFIWSYDILCKYFQVVSEDSLISNLKEEFQKAERPLKDPKLIEKQPYLRNFKTFSKVSYEDFYKLTQQRRSVRWFEDKPVPRELIDKAILAANQSPSACNRQPFEYHIIDDPKLLKKVVNLPMGTAGYSHNIPVMIIAVGNLNAYFSERDRHLIYIDASLANMSFMLALETLGLSSCAINWPDIEKREKKMEEVLMLEPYQRPIMCLGVGYPDMEGMVAYSEKKDLNKIRFYNKGKE